MGEKGTRFSQVISATSCIMVDLERIRVKMELGQQPTQQEIQRLEQSIADFKRILQAYKEYPIND